MNFEIHEIMEQYDFSRGLPRELYVNPTIFDIELQAVYGRHWLLAGHVSELSAAGDYILLSVGTQSLVIVRQSSGAVKTLHNMCRHRGAPLCDDEHGNKSKFICRYHGWTFALDGSLANAPRMFEGFDKSKFGLFHCHTIIVEGLIFVSIADNPPDFSSSSDAIRTFAGPHELDGARVCASLTLLVNANWKVVVENSWECYHCPVVHPMYCRIMPYADVAGRTSKRATDDNQIKWEAKTKAKGYLTGGLDLLNEGVLWCQRYPVREGLFTQSLDGLPVAPLMGRYTEFDCGVTAIQLNPGYVVTICNDYAKLTRITPRSVGMTEIRYSWLVKSTAVEGVDYDVEKVMAFWRQTAMEDISVCEMTQRGLASPRYLPGPFGLAEGDVARFNRWYIKNMTEHTSFI